MIKRRCYGLLDPVQFFRRIQLDLEGTNFSGNLKQDVVVDQMIHSAIWFNRVYES